MKNIKSTILLILICTTSVMSQTTINFEYDSAGSRVSRTIELPANPAMFGGGGGTPELREEKDFGSF